MIKSYDTNVLKIPKYPMILAEKTEQVYNLKFHVNLNMNTNDWEQCSFEHCPQNILTFC